MSSEVDKISDEIVKVINNQHDSLYFTYMKAVGDTFLNFTGDIGFLVYEFLDGGNRYSNFTEQTRLLRRLKKGVSKTDLSKIAEIVIRKYTSSLKADFLIKASSYLGKLTGKQIINMTVINDITLMLSAKLIPRIIISAGISTIVSVSGSLSRAVYTSRALSEEVPNVYYALRNHGDLDLFYFLVESYIGPFVNALKLKEKKPDEFNKVFIEVIRKLAQ